MGRNGRNGKNGKRRGPRRLKVWQKYLLNAVVVGLITFLSTLSVYWPVGPKEFYAAGMAGGLTLLTGIRGFLSGPVPDASATGRPTG